MSPTSLDPRTVRAFRRGLTRWFARSRRDFPWRRSRTPYRVWISELMLQQTRADVVVPYFLRFLRKFPTIEALAAAPRQAVLKAWEGLGYYARARNAHDLARRLVAEHGGEFPREAEALCALPGIGPYTAAAVGSLALGLDLAVVDGNVIRVLSRAMGYLGDAASGAARRQFQAWADALIEPGRAGVMNEALMELGATVCTPRNPQCAGCAVRAVCRARAEGRPEEYPVKKPKKKVPHKIVGAGIVVDSRGRLLIAQRRETSMLGGLWEFPGGTRERGETMRECIRRELDEELGIDTAVGDRLITVFHAYSHFTIDLHAHWARIVRGRPRTIHCADFAWATLKDLAKYPFSAADRQIIQALEKVPSAKWRVPNGRAPLGTRQSRLRTSATPS